MYIVCVAFLDISDKNAHNKCLFFMELRRRRLMANNNQKKRKKSREAEKISSLKIFWLSSKAKIERILFSSLSHTTKGITYPTNSVYIYKKMAFALQINAAFKKSAPAKKTPVKKVRREGCF